MYGRQNSGIFCRNEIIVTQNMLCKLLYFAEGLRCRLKYLGNDYTYIKITRGNPELSLSISLKDGILEAGNAGNKVISLCEDGSILYYNWFTFISQISSLLETCCHFIYLYSIVQTELSGLVAPTKTALLKKCCQLLKNI